MAINFLVNIIYIFIGILLTVAFEPFIKRKYDAIIGRRILNHKIAKKKESKQRQLAKLKIQLEEAEKYFNDKIAFGQKLTITLIVFATSFTIVYMYELVLSFLFITPGYIKNDFLSYIFLVIIFLLKVIIGAILIRRGLIMVDLWARVNHFDKYKKNTEIAIKELSCHLGYIKSDKNY